jgi:hypothetical protein
MRLAAMADMPAGFALLLPPQTADASPQQALMLPEWQQSWTPKPTSPSWAQGWPASAPLSIWPPPVRR